jgi:flavodoxin
VKVLIVYYSRTGHTRDVAAAIAKSIGAEVERITDHRDRDGWLGYIKCTIDQKLNLCPPLKPMRTDPTKYDIVVVGTPIWGRTCCAPIRTFLKHVEGRLRKVAFFCAMQEEGEAKTFMDMQGHCVAEPFATFSITEGEIERGRRGDGLAASVANFAECCRTGMTVVRKKRDGEA